MITAHPVQRVRKNAVDRYIIQRITFYRFTLFSNQRSAMPFYKLIPAIHRHQQCVTIVSSDGYVNDGPSARRFYHPAVSVNSTQRIDSQWLFNIVSSWRNKPH
ncbi:hypothetical protein [Enterobacter soli]|uniref:hypothetical protein n=1 Tax=Enterobacter soli TaxID=885040 RepID=UPI003B75C5F7